MFNGGEVVMTTGGSSRFENGFVRAPTQNLPNRHTARLKRNPLTPGHPLILILAAATSAALTILFLLEAARFSYRLPSLDEIIALFP